MVLYDDFVSARAVAPEKVQAVQLSRSVNHLVGVTPVLVTRPAGMRRLTVRCESGTIRARPGKYDYADHNFGAHNVAMAPDTIGILPHGFETGDGPFQITMVDAELTAGTSVVIGTNNTFTRTVGNWGTDGFWNGGTFTVTGSGSNDGTYTVKAPILGLVLTVNEDITVAEGAQVDLVMNGPAVPLIGAGLLTNFWIIYVASNTFQIAASLADALAGTFIALNTAGAMGTFNIGGPAGWAAAAVAAASKTDGYGSIAITAGNEVSFAAPERITLVGMSGSDACSYWWGK